MNRIKEIRTEKGVMQSELAALVGKSQPYIHDLENNRRDAKPETWKAIADALQCSVEELRQ